MRCLESEKSRLLAASFWARAAAVSNEKLEPLEDEPTDFRALPAAEPDDDRSGVEKDWLLDEPEE
ncbi:MAG: hypothetical protein HYY23_18250 [Verrucomicrobia bacterium]|nr:hypothetical protein [Verrucomicrobiota bacterium]